MASSSSWLPSDQSHININNMQLITDSDRKRLIVKLNHGREIADRLRILIRDDGSAVLSAQGLVAELLDTFTHSLMMLSSSAAVESDDVSQVMNSPCRKSEDSGDSCKRPASKERRGCYKRRRTSETNIKETPTLYEDSHAWRKYGQKVILNAKHPRSYFRCTHKFDQGCQATKQVQKIQDDPPLFRTTYHGQHTCTNLIKSNYHLIVDAPTPDDDSSIIWSFQSRQPDYKPDTGSVINPIVAELDSATKQENQEELNHHQIQYSSSSPLSDGACDYFMPAAFDTSAHLAAFSSRSDHGDLISSEVYSSCTASTPSTMEMDMMVGSVDLDDFLQF